MNPKEQASQLRLATLKSPSDMAEETDPQNTTGQPLGLAAEPGSASRLLWNDAAVPTNAARIVERNNCPFCDSDCTGLSHSDGYKVMICLNCGAKGPYLIDKTGDWNRDDFRAIAMWNQRGGWPSPNSDYPEQVSV